MLEEIAISNLGIIKKATLPFTHGLTAITGETGAGKTMVLSALHLLLGKRSNSNMVGQNSPTLTVEGCWGTTNLAAVPKIEETGAVIEDNQLFINRTVQNDGKSRAVIGGKTTPSSVLAGIGSQLVNIHGQSDQIRLKNTNAQRDSLDSYYKETIIPALETYKESYTSYKKHLTLIEDVKNNSFTRKREITALEAFIEDFDNVLPEVDEMELLEKEIATLSNFDTIRQGTAEALSALNPEEIPSVFEQINTAIRKITQIAEYDSSLDKIVEKFNEISENLDEVASDLENYSDNLDEDSLNRLYEAQDRELSLKSFIRKYGNDLNSIIEERDTAQEELEQLQGYNQPMEELEETLEKLSKTAQKDADIVTKLRVKAAKELERKVNEELVGLSMGSSKMIIQLTSKKLSTNGQDDIEFMLKTGGAAESRPIAKSASGGELSRIMLALEVVLADPQSTPTFVFDEVDSGVGGTAAIEIGKRLAKLAKEAQVIVVTHLPQVAAYADNHLSVTKSSTDEYTETSVSQLSQEGRVEELTRMLSGMTESDSGRAHATDLMNHAWKYKVAL